MKTKILTALAIATLLTSCEKSESENLTSSDTRTEVKFTSGISTRVSGTTWESDDVIGITMCTADNWDSDVWNEFTNAKYTISSSEGSTATFTSETPFYYPDSGVADFYAYYPYREIDYNNYYSLYLEINTADQSTAEKTKSLEEYMYAYTRVEDTSEKEEIILNFTHSLSKIVFKVNLIGNALTADLSDFFFTNTYTTGYLFTLYPTLNYDDSISENITLNYEDGTIEMLIIPQLLTSSELYFSQDGVYMSVSLNGIFKEGTQYNYTLNIGENYVTLGDMTITDWGEVVDETIYTTEDMPTYTTSDISSSNIPSGNIWIITDSGNLDYSYDFLSALNAADRKITLIMPNITTLNSRALQNCTNLTSVSLPNATTIGNSAFRDCSSLTSVDLPEATAIGNSAFCNCTALTSIDLPKVETIESYAFYGCTALASTDLPEATSIGEYSFLLVSDK